VSFRHSCNRKHTQAMYYFGPDEHACCLLAVVGSWKYAFMWKKCFEVYISGIYVADSQQSCKLS